MACTYAPFTNECPKDSELTTSQFRFFRLMTARLADRRQHSISPRLLLLPAITSSRSPLTECDINLHKSNSTYFTDLDISRSNLVMLLFRNEFQTPYLPRKPTLVLGGVQCTFRKQIKPYEPYEMWTRVLSWDEKWLYVVTHFVPKGKFLPAGYELQSVSETRRRVLSRDEIDGDDEAKRYVFASAISRYIFKSGRKTVTPEEMFKRCGLLQPDNQADVEECYSGADIKVVEKVEKARREALPIARLENGWDSVHALFDGNNSQALGRYTDLLWR